MRAYLASTPPAARRALKSIRAAIRAAAPDAVDGFSYGIPCFRLEGRPLMWYAAWTEHVSLYPLTKSLKDAHASELAKYKVSKGTVRFSLSVPPPVAFVKRLVKTRVAEMRAARAR